MQRLYKQHAATDANLRRLIEDPTCEICRIDIVEPAKIPGKNEAAARLVVDHDHRCCPTSRSCGACVRGFLCFQCNAALGLAHEDPTRLRALARYAERHTQFSISSPRLS